MSFNVLIVDDSKSIRSVIKKIISISGFKMEQCLEAGNGLEALRIMRENWVDIILSDINMPEMNGIKMLEEMGKDDLLANIPVIIISTESRNERIKDAFHLGAKGFLKKPFAPEEVKKALYEIIGGNDEKNADGDDEDLDF
jgi:two-component system chemotaxis response regulator CheY